MTILVPNKDLRWEFIQTTSDKCTEAILRLIPQFGMRPIKINDGACGLFSAMIVKALGGQTEDIYESFTYGIYPGHCWITCCGKHFDAECPFGVDNPHDLPWFKRTGVRNATTE